MSRADGHPPQTFGIAPIRRRLERAAIDGESPVGVGVRSLGWRLSSAGHVISGVKLGGPPPKAKYTQRPIAHSTVRER